MESAGFTRELVCEKLEPGRLALVAWFYILTCVRPASHLKMGLLLQSISSPGSGIWSDGKDKNDVSQPHTWNVEVFIDIVKEVVSELALILILTLPENKGYLVTIPCDFFHPCFYVQLCISCVF